MTTSITAQNIVKSVSARQARDFDGAGRGTHLNVKIDAIYSEEGFNARMLNSRENSEHIASIVRHLVKGGSPSMLECVPVILEDGRKMFKLVDGHCNFQAIEVANEVYGLNIETAAVMPVAMTEAQQRLHVLNSNNQKALNMIEKGKMYADILEQDELTQAQLAAEVNCTQPQISMCLRAFRMPVSLKNLVKDGYLSDSEALARHDEAKKSVDDKNDIEQVAARSQQIADSIVKQGNEQVAQGGTRKVTGKTLATGVVFNARTKNLVTNVATTLKASLADVQTNEDGSATVTLTAEQLELLKSLGAMAE